VRALAYLSPGRIGLVDRQVPEPGATGAVVRATLSSICTSDLHLVAGAKQLPAGRILGHESVGVVSGVGPEVTGVQVGQRVLAPAITPCGRCAFCQRGQQAQCGGDHNQTRFVSRRDGSLAEWFLVTDADYNLTPIPDDVPDEAAIYAADMIPTGLTAAQHAAIAPGGTILVTGQGPVGLCATAGARLLGAGLVIAVDPIPRRRELALKFGADVALDPSAQDVPETVRDLCGSDGADSAIDAVGGPQSLADCLRAVRRGGTVSSVGFHAYGDTLRLPLAALNWGLGDHTLRMSLTPGGRELLTRVLRLIRSGRIDPTPLTTHRVPLAEVELGFELMRDKGSGVLKVLVDHDLVDHDTAVR
jgi:isopropanol dehydrogenase (NADP+)